MCGINGIFGKEKLDDPGAAVERMTRALAHRGPDAEGFFENENLVLGHRRLSIFDTSTAGNQPFISPDGQVVLVFNGAIYNYIELKAQLPDYPYRTQTDTEVILAAYTRWGIRCIEHFNGMFAFALWDNRLKKGFIVRDRLGIKPLYYALVGSSFVFASEIRALLASGLVARKLDHVALADYLRYQTVHAPRTIIQGIRLMEPGTYIELSDEGFEQHIFWSPSSHYDSQAEGQNNTQITNTVRELLTDSVQLRMRADVPFGAFLSGGIDSSLLVGLMSQGGTRPVDTFSVTFDEKAFDESSYSGAVAKKFNTHHHDIRLSARDFLRYVPEALAAQDHPGGDGPNSWVVSKMTKEQGITMALSGLGGDELFAGYGIFTQAIKARDNKWITSFPKPIRRLAARAYRMAKPGVASEKLLALMSQDYLDFEYVYPLSRQVLSEERIGQLLGLKKLPANRVFEILCANTAPGSPGFGLPHLSKVSVAEILTYMQHTLLRDADQMSMAHALEVRVPFLDHRLVEYVLGVPDRFKFPHTPKKLLTDSFPDLLPESLINRPKMGFTFPWALWMKNELRPLCEEALANSALSRVLAPGQADRLWQAFLHDDPQTTWSRVWPLVALSAWMKQNDIEA